MRSTDAMAQEVMALQRGLDILDRMVERMEEGALIEIYDIRTVLRYFRDFGSVYPQLTEERELLSEIEGALNPKHGIGFVRNSRRLILLIRNRLEKEEDEIIAAGFMTGRNLTDTHATFSRLERKYASKSRSAPAEMERRAHA